MDFNQEACDRFKAQLSRIQNARVCNDSDFLKELRDQWYGARGCASNIGIKLAELFTSEQIEILVGWVNAASLEARTLAADILGELQASQALVPICRLLDSLEPAVRLAGVGAIGFWKEPEITQLLIERLRDSDIEVRRIAAQWLSYGRNESRIYDIMMELFLYSDDEKLRAIGGGGLYGRVDARCLSVMLDQMKSKDWKQRERAISIIGSIKDPNAVDALQALRRARRDSKPQVRKAARSGLWWWDQYQKESGQIVR